MSVPALPLSVFEQFAELLTDRTDTHPLGCHNLRIPERVEEIFLLPIGICIRLPAFV